MNKKKGLSYYNVAVLAKIRNNAKLKGIYFKVMDEINVNEFVVLATKEATKESKLIYIKDGQMVAHLAV